MNSNIQMMAFNTNTYENLGSFPELAIDAKILFPQLKSVYSIDYEKLKRKLLEAVFESVTLANNKVAAN